MKREREKMKEEQWFSTLDRLSESKSIGLNGLEGQNNRPLKRELTLLVLFSISALLT